MSSMQVISLFLGVLFATRFFYVRATVGVGELSYGYLFLGALFIAIFWESLKKRRTK